MTWAIAGVAIVTFIVSAVSPVFLRPLLERSGVVDVPNERSSHAEPTLRAGGLAPLIGWIVGIATTLSILPQDAWLLTIAGVTSVALAMLGFFDDLRGLSALVRLGAQFGIALAAAGVIAIHTGAGMWWFVPIAAAFVVGYVNAANFVDGIDGLSGMHGVVVGLAFTAAGTLTHASWLIYIGAVLAAAFAAFLPWNLSRSGFFLGDVGSYLLGGSVAIIAVAALATGSPVLLVLPPLAIYVADTSTTVVRRALRGEQVMSPHRTHVYQRLTDTGLSHVQVSLIVSAFAGVTSLIGVGTWASGAPFWLAWVLIVLVCVTYVMLPRWRNRALRRASSLPGPREGSQQDSRRTGQEVRAQVRVLILAHQYWPTPGGASQVIGALVRELMERRMGVTVLTNRGASGELGESAGPHGERVIAVSGPESSGVSLRRIADLGRFAAASMSRSKHEDFDLVVSDAPPTSALAASRIAQKRKVPFVYYFSDSWGAASQGRGSLPGRVMNWIITRIENRALCDSRLTVGVTWEMTEIARRGGARNVIEVPNGIDTREAVDAVGTWDHPATNRPYFLYAGNAGVVHGAEIFVDAAELLWHEGVDFDLVFMGYGIGHAYARSAAERWGDRIQVLGNQSTATVATAYRGSVGALSSLRPLPSYAHARPMKSLTGAACGAPAVFAGAGEFARVIEENQLGFVADWEPQSAADAMRRALELDRSDDRDRTRQEIRAFAQRHFDERAGARRVADEITSILISSDKAERTK